MDLKRCQNKRPKEKQIQIHARTSNHTNGNIQYNKTNKDEQQKNGAIKNKWYDKLYLYGEMRTITCWKSLNYGDEWSSLTEVCCFCELIYVYRVYITFLLCDVTSHLFQFFECICVNVSMCACIVVWAYRSTCNSFFLSSSSISHKNKKNKRTEPNKFILTFMLLLEFHCDQFD